MQTISPDLVIVKNDGPNYAPILFAVIPLDYRLDFKWAGEFLRLFAGATT